MSADNFYYISQNPGDSRWYVWMGFMSDPEDVIVFPSRESASFTNYVAALDHAMDDYTEYGEHKIDWPGFQEDQEKDE